MKTQSHLNGWKNWISLMFLLLALNSLTVSAQGWYVRVLCTKVEPANYQAYQKMLENIRPAFQLAKQNGSIVDWYFYEVKFTGEGDDYNFVSLFVYDSWAKTEKLPALIELLKKANPKVDANALANKFFGMAKVIKQDLAVHLDGVDSDIPAKYFRVNYIKSLPGKEVDYVKLERETWKPIHKALVENRNSAGWGFWQIISPSGTSAPYCFLTSDFYSDYAKINEHNAEAVTAAAKKIHPGKNIEALMEETINARDVVKSELWELLLSTAEDIKSTAVGN